MAFAWPVAVSVILRVADNQRPPQLRHLAFVHLCPPFGVTIKWLAQSLYSAPEDPLFLDHLPFGRHQRACPFPLYQLRIVDLAGGIVQNRDQVPVAPSLNQACLLASMCSSIPGMGRRRRVRPPPLLFVHQLGRLQG
jgi:hypothetical protein